MSTIELIIPAPDDVHEVLVALLEDDDVLGFEQRTGELAVFFRGDDWSGHRLDDIRNRCRGLAAGRVRLRRISDRNWNEEWEASIRPIRVGRFVVQPSWAEGVETAESPGPTRGAEVTRREEALDAPVELVIDPKMSFGTAWHESTRLLLRSIPERIRTGDRILDAGTGTGILAIAALKLGARRAVGFDIDPWSLRNASENAVLNGVHDRFDVRSGTLDGIPESERFDVALANINRAVLLETLPGLMKRAPVTGLSGLLVDDRMVMLERIGALGLRVLEERREGTWWSVWVAEDADDGSESGDRQATSATR